MGGEVGMVSPETVSPTKLGSQYYQHYAGNPRRRAMHSDSMGESFITTIIITIKHRFIVQALAFVLQCQDLQEH